MLRLLDPQEGEKILDVACGQGIVSESIVHHANVERVVGVDVSDKLIEAARSRSRARTSTSAADSSTRTRS